MPRFPLPRWIPAWLLETATGWLILANVFIWLVMVVIAQRVAIGAGIIRPFPGAMTLAWGANVPPLVPSEPWRLVTSAFLHANLMHLAGNMFVLWYLGQRLEGAFGRGRFLLLYMA
jgi:membrane associated rhomboid family serine protease